MSLVGAENACRPTLDSGLAWPKGEHTAGVARVIRYGTNANVASSSLFDWVGRPVVLIVKWLERRLETLEHAEQTVAPCWERKRTQFVAVPGQPYARSSIAFEFMR